MSGHQLLKSFHESPLLTLVELLNYVELVQLLSANISGWDHWEHLFVVVCSTALLGFYDAFDTDSFLVWVCCFFSQNQIFQEKGLWKTFWLCISLSNEYLVSIAVCCFHWFAVLQILFSDTERKIMTQIIVSRM